MYRFILTITALFITLSLAVSDVAEATTEPTPVVPDVAQLELNKQMKNPKVPSLKYWDKVAWCETHRNWKDGGNWAGGLGIARSTWIGYGGRDFASVPNKATRIEQIVIANRIAVFGHQTKNVYMTLDDKLNNKPFFRPRAGFNGWGCIKNYIGKPKPRKGKK